MKRDVVAAGGMPAIEALHVLGALKLRIEETQGSKPGRPEFEIFAPDGYSFDGDAHSMIMRDTRERARQMSLTLRLRRCVAGCECGWDADRASHD